MIPSIMALAEANGKSGRDVITAIVAGYEVAVRIAKAINPDIASAAFTPPARYPCSARPPGRLSCLVATKKASRRRSAWPPCSRRASSHT